MLNVTLICVGKIKEKFYREAAEEYKKRLSRFCSLKLIEVKDEPTPDNGSDKEKNIVLEKEGARILEKIPKGAYVISLCVEGRQMPSERLAETLDNLALGGTGSVAFIIGGSLGLSDEVKQRSAMKLSFSQMTFPHQLMRVVLLEQIYRAFTISKGITYHK